MENLSLSVALSSQFCHTDTHKTSRHSETKASVQFLRQPYETMTDAQIAAANMQQALRAVVHGDAYALAQSPFALDRMNVYGVGVYQHPRTEKLHMPCRGKLLHVSNDRSLWVFGVNNQLRVRIEVRSDQPLPLAYALIRPGSLVEAGQQFARLHHLVLGTHSMVVTTVQDVSSNDSAAIVYAANPVAGKMSAAEDTIIQLATLDSKVD